MNASTTRELRDHASSRRVTSAQSRYTEDGPQARARLEFYHHLDRASLGYTRIVARSYGADSRTATFRIWDTYEPSLNQ